MHDDYEFEDDEDFVSKTQIKAEMTELRQLGLNIAELPQPVYDSLELPVELRAGIDEYKRITHKNAKKRQASFVGKLMRKADHEAIRAQLQDIQEANHRATRQLHLVEQWRDRLLTDGEPALSDFLNTYPDCDRQQLRNLIRNAEREKAQNKPPSSARKLFRFIQLLAAQ